MSTTMTQDAVDLMNLTTTALYAPTASNLLEIEAQLSELLTRYAESVEAMVKNDEATDEDGFTEAQVGFSAAENRLTQFVKRHIRL